jgi:hypothetical protein
MMMPIMYKPKSARPGTHMPYVSAGRNAPMSKL